MSSRSILVLFISFMTKGPPEITKPNESDNNTVLYNVNIVYNENSKISTARLSQTVPATNLSPTGNAPVVRFSQNEKYIGESGLSKRILKHRKNWLDRIYRIKRPFLTDTR